jgi:hypothetical protein
MGRAETMPLAGMFGSVLPLRARVTAGSAACAGSTRDGSMTVPTAVAGLQPRAAWHQPVCEANQALTLMCGFNVFRMHRTRSGRTQWHPEWHDTPSTGPLFQTFVSISQHEPLKMPSQVAPSSTWETPDTFHDPGTMSRSERFGASLQVMRSRLLRGTVGCTSRRRQVSLSAMPSSG